MTETLVTRLASKARSLWKAQIRRDPQARAFRRWFADRGDESLRLNYPDLDDSSLVVDAGGFHGDWAAAIRARYGSRVIIFEPVSAFVVRLSQRFAGDPAVEVIPAALAADAGHREILVDGDASSGAGGGAHGKSEMCRFVSAAEWIAAGGIDSIDLLKVNIEGGEFELLDHLLDRDLIRRVRHIQVQFHAFFPDAITRRDKIRSRLAATHRCTWNYPFVWENWTRA